MSRIRTNQITNQAADGAPTVQNGLVISGVTTSTTFSGSGASLTNLNGSNIASGTVPVARIGTGTKNTSTFYRGDGSFATVTSTTINNNADNRIITGSGTANTLEGEANLTFDGTKLTVTSSSKDLLYLNSTHSNGPQVPFQTSGTTFAYIGSATSLFSTGSSTDLGIRAESSKHILFGIGGNEKLRIDSSGRIGTNSTVRSANGGLDLCSQGATNLGTLTLGASGGQNGQNRNSNTENQYRIMMPTYADPSLMVTQLYGVSGSGGHDINYGGYTGWAYSVNTHKFYTAANATTGGGTERLRITKDGYIKIGESNSGNVAFSLVTNGSGMLLSKATTGNPNNGQTLGDIGFNAYSDSQTTSSADALIRGQAAGNFSGSSAPTDLLFFTKPASTGPGSAPTERMRINKDGIVTTPQQPMASTTLATQGTGYLGHSATLTNQGGHFNTSNSRFVCPVSGYYLVSLMAMTNNSNDTMDIELRKNGSNPSNILVPYQAATGGQYNQVSGACIIDCAANDYLQFHVNNGSIYGGRHSAQCFALLG